MKNLILERPLVCFDLETTGVDIAKDRIVQIGLIRVEPDGSSQRRETLVNPQVPIPPAATAIHGISDADVADQPTLAQLVPELVELFADADVAGFNSIQFDLPLLNEEMKRVGCPLDPAGRRHFDAMRIFHAKEKRDLTAAFQFYCDQELEGAHTALADASATLEILDAQLDRYADLPRDAAGLHRFCNIDEGKWVDNTRKFTWNDQGEAAFAFGKNRGRTLRDITATSPDYLDWIASSDFGSEVKQIAADAKKGRFPHK
ncbi:MAG: 3'-5' exonuclease [bacterium]